ncbi:MAG: hypothetical protein CMP49_03945 [Flavobacteriales bacterium]|nr:hypothetical protein [Flavobacteriales bacterium]
MKKILLKLILFPYIFLSQGVISNYLDEKMIQANDDELIPIIISIHDNFNLIELKNEFIQNKTPVKQRASIICENMQSVAKVTQEPILNLIAQNNKNHKNLKSSWIINAIFIDANKTLIKLIATHPNIDLINLQMTNPDVIDFFSAAHNTIEINNSTEPGIEAINVRPLWEMGYTGKGTLVFNYDTGVWPEHPAFSDRFFGNLYPLDYCWDGYFSNKPNGHVSDHGTHTLGTMTGLVQESNDTIGIAFNAYWIANDFVTSTVETLPPIEDMITSFEWALNPDNNTATYHDVPDVINNSWRWYNEMDTFQCSGYAVELMNVIEAAGIANIFSAGNNGPNNTGVRSPQRINTNVVNTFCVGSINGNDESYPISNFSCRGPTQCPGEGSLSIYPEVVAPGQNIRSAWGKNDFNTISGTSMASPHVSGAVLLLKEAFPFLSGQEILLALYNTASDLGEDGEDNTFGMGIINAYAAFNYLANSYNPIPPNAIINDIILESVENIPNEISCTSSFSPLLNIYNNTDSTINEIKISYEDYLNQNNSDSILFEINLLPYSSAEIEFPMIVNNDYGDKEFTFKVNTINALNENDEHNNRKMVRFKYKPTFTLPYFEDFQNGFEIADWHILNNDYSRTWDTISTEGLSNNNISSYVNLYDYNPRSGQKDDLISPNINLLGDSIKLSFQVAYQKYNSSSKQDTLQIFLSDDCGKNYNYLIFEKGGEDLSTIDDTLANFIPSENSHWREEIVDLSYYTNEDIMLKFTSTNWRGNNIFIDNINIYNLENATIDNHEKSFIVNPNPSNNIFELTLNNQYIQSICVYNSVNQKVLTKYINRTLNNFEIDLSDKNSGIYIVDIKTNNQQEIIKIIKN